MVLRLMRGTELTEGIFVGLFLLRVVFPPGGSPNPSVMLSNVANGHNKMFSTSFVEMFC